MRWSKVGHQNPELLARNKGLYQTLHPVFWPVCRPLRLSEYIHPVVVCSSCVEGALLAYEAGHFGEICTPHFALCRDEASARQSHESYRDLSASGSLAETLLIPNSLPGGDPAQVHSHHFQPLLLSFSPWLYSFERRHSGLPVVAFCWVDS